MTNIQFELNPTLPYLNTEAVKGYFYVQYPSGWSYWQIQNADGQSLKDGNYTFRQEILAQWTDSDQILIDDILEAAPWSIKAPEPTPVPEVVDVDAVVVEPVVESIAAPEEDAAAE